MPAALGGPRLLLRRLREAMAEPVSPQARLDRIVVLIAANVVAEVCSVYVLRDDNILELFATEGLNREAVHLTRLRADEGLVGLIASTAEPLALSDAQKHPAFSYRPETGEEIYHAFLGVPLLRAGHTLGVLTVQNKTYRVYSEEEIEALQTTAMVLSEMIASGELDGLGSQASTANRRPVMARGVSLSDGIGLGHVVLHEPRLVVKTLIAENVDREVARLDAAIGACARPSTPWWSGATGSAPPNPARFWKPCGCSPTTRAGCGGCARPSPRASPPRPPWSGCSRTTGRGCCASPTPTCASACTTSTTSPTASCGR